MRAMEPVNPCVRAEESAEAAVAAAEAGAWGLWRVKALEAAYELGRAAMCITYPWVCNSVVRSCPFFTHYVATPLEDPVAVVSGLRGLFRLYAAAYSGYVWLEAMNAHLHVWGRADRSGLVAVKTPP